MERDLEAVLAAMRAIARPTGVRIAEICAAMQHSIKPPRVMALLDAQTRLGVVRYDPLGGRWHLTEASGLSTKSPAPTSTSTTLPPTPPAPPTLPQVHDPGIPTERDDDGVIDLSQRTVVRAASETRQVVVAGPGFGKTAVACGRVAWLLCQGIEASRILLLSFTRTAMREMRARIVAMASDVASAAAVDVRTLDSFAWRVRTGLSEAPREGQSFAANISDTVAMIAQPDEELRNYLDHFDHVLVDEAQDLVGPRAELVVALLGALREGAGFTVFLDPAQAIYDWSEDAEDGEEPPPFDQQLRAMQPAPVWHELLHLHRTQDPALRALLLGARRLVLDAPTDAYSRLRAVLEGRATADQCFADGLAAELAARAGGELMVLARRRGEALELSSRLSQLEVQHRLRFGALPQLAAPWIAAVLNEAYRRVGSLQVDAEDVEEAWEAVRSDNPWLADGWSFQQAWRLLRRLGPAQSKRHVDIRRVSARLGGATLPDDALLRDVGSGGLIVSTVHGSKGREAAEALLLLTAQHDRVLDEARVLYVGLSRAKERLDVRRFGGMHWRHLPDSGRPFRRSKAGHLHIEVGRAGDLDVRDTARVLGGEIAQQQETLARFDGRCRPVRVWSFADRAWARCVVTDGDAPVKLAALSTPCTDDLRSAARAMSKGAKTPTYVNHLRWFDLGSVGLPADAMLDAVLPDPWQSTRLFLMPVVVGPGVAGGHQ